MGKKSSREVILEIGYWFSFITSLLLLYMSPTVLFFTVNFFLLVYLGVRNKFIRKAGYQGKVLLAAILFFAFIFFTALMIVPLGETNDSALLLYYFFRYYILLMTFVMLVSVATAVLVYMWVTSSHDKMIVEDDSWSLPEHKKHIVNGKWAVLPYEGLYPKLPEIEQNKETVESIQLVNENLNIPEKFYDEIPFFENTYDEERMTLMEIMLIVIPTFKTDRASISRIIRFLSQNQNK